MANDKQALSKRAQHDDLEDETLPEEITSLLDGVAPEKRREIIRIISMAQIRSYSPEAEVSKKITQEHITSMIELQKKAMDHDYADRKETRRYTFVYSLLACAVLVFVIVFLKDKPDIMEKILYTVGGFLAGGFGGYGLCKYKTSKE